MRLHMEFRSNSLNSDRLQHLASEVRRDLVSECGIPAEMLGSPARPGEKGDPITVGAIVIALATSGTLVAALELIRSYIGRVPTLEISMKREDGATLTITAKDVSETHFEETQKIAKNFIDRLRNV